MNNKRETECCVITNPIFSTSRLSCRCSTHTPSLDSLYFSFECPDASTSKQASCLKSNKELDKHTYLQSMQVKVEPNSIANTHQFSSPFLRMSSGNQYPRSIGNPESGLTSESSYHQPSFCNRYPHDASHPNYNYHYSAPTSSSSSSNAAQYSASNIHFNQNHMSNSDRNSGHYYPNPYKKNIATDTDEANRSRPPNLSDKLNDALKANHYKSLSNGAYNDTNAESELNDKVNESHSDDEAQDDTVANNFDDTNENSGNNLTLDDDDFIEEEENGMNMISSKSHNLLVYIIKL